MAISTQLSWTPVSMGDTGGIMYGINQANSQFSKALSGVVDAFSTDPEAALKKSLAESTINQNTIKAEQALKADLANKAQVNGAEYSAALKDAYAIKDPMQRANTLVAAQTLMPKAQDLSTALAPYATNDGRAADQMINLDRIRTFGEDATNKAMSMQDKALQAIRGDAASMNQYYQDAETQANADRTFNENKRQHDITNSHWQSEFKRTNQNTDYERSVRAAHANVEVLATQLAEIQKSLIPGTATSPDTLKTIQGLRDSLARAQVDYIATVGGNPQLLNITKPTISQATPTVPQGTSVLDNGLAGVIADGAANTQSVPAVTPVVSTVPATSAAEVPAIEQIKTDVNGNKFTSRADTKGAARGTLPNVVSPRQQQQFEAKVAKLSNTAVSSMTNRDIQDYGSALLQPLDKSLLALSSDNQIKMDSQINTLQQQLKLHEDKALQTIYDQRDKELLDKGITDSSLRAATIRSELFTPDPTTKKSVAQQVVSNNPEVLKLTRTLASAQQQKDYLVAAQTPSKDSFELVDSLRQSLQAYNPSTLSGLTPEKESAIKSTVGLITTLSEQIPNIQKVLYDGKVPKVTSDLDTLIPTEKSRYITLVDQLQRYSDGSPTFNRNMQIIKRAVTNIDGEVTPKQARDLFTMIASATSVKQ